MEENKSFNCYDMGLKMNNCEPEPAFLRDTFLGCEEEYLEKLKRDPIFVGYVHMLQSRYNARQLRGMAEIAIDKVETCQVKPEELEDYEHFIAACSCAIVDYTLEKTLELTPDGDGGRER